jgi:hypothetical protein
MFYLVDDQGEFVDYFGKALTAQVSGPSSPALRRPCTSLSAASRRLCGGRRRSLILPPATRVPHHISSVPHRISSVPHHISSVPHRISSVPHRISSVPRALPRRPANGSRVPGVVRWGAASTDVHAHAHAHMRTRARGLCRARSGHAHEPHTSPRAAAAGTQPSAGAGAGMSHGTARV